MDILFGPNAVDTKKAIRSELSKHHCVGDMYDIVTVTPMMIAYAACAVSIILVSVYDASWHSHS